MDCKLGNGVFSSSTLFSIGLLFFSGCGAPLPDDATDKVFLTEESALSTATSPMAKERMRSTATTLLDGRVLIVGGWSSWELDTAELYDPATGTFSSAGTMAFRRDFHTATRLADGRVLIAGGYSGAPGSFSSAEIFSPSAGTWVQTGSMTTGRSRHTATMLSDGRVLVAGGLDASGAWIQVASAEIYDPSTGQWTVLASLNQGRLNHTATLLADNKVMVSGGYRYSPSAITLGSTEIYSPSQNTWTLAGDMLGTRSEHSAVRLADGRVLVTGGWRYTCNASGSCASEGHLASTEIFAPSLGTWSSAGSMLATRFRHTAALTTSGDALFFGGYVGGSVGTAVERYNVSSGTFSSMSPLIQARNSHFTARLSDGRFLIAGGSDPSNLRLSHAEIYEDGAGCSAATCGSLGKNCGMVSDGCGEMIYCGSCQAGAVCGSSNVCADDIPPTTALTAPTNGTTVSGTLTVSADAADNVGIARVDFYDGSTLIGSDTTSPYTISWDTRTVGNGSHTLTSKAIDTYGSSTVSSPVTITVQNDLSAPSTSITSPGSGATVTGTIAIDATATDNVSVMRVEFYAGVSLLGVDTTAPFNATWNTSTTVDGSYSLTTKAFDAAGNIGTSPSVTVTVKNALVGGAVYDAALRAPKCGVLGAVCDTGTLVNGRAQLGPETNQPNTINGSCVDGTSGSYHADESLDRLKISTLDGTTFAAGKTVKIEATVWAYASFSSDYLDIYYASNANSPAWTFLATLSPAGAGVQTLSTTYSLPVGSLQAVRGVFRYGGSASPCGGGGYDDRDDLVFAVETPVDTTPPTISITSPINGSTVRGVTSVATNSSDDWGVVRVEFHLDGAAYLTSSTPPFSFSWNTASTTNGSHTLLAKAFDAAGNSASSAPVTVTVDNDKTPPSAAVTSPANNSTVSGLVTIEASATDNVGVTRVDLYVGNSVIATDTTAPYSTTWDTTVVANGSYTIYSRAYDAAGNTTTSSLVSVTVNNTTGSQAVFDTTLRAPKCGNAGNTCDSGTLLNGRGNNESNQPNTINNSCADGTSGVFHSDESLDRLKISTLDGTPLAPGKTARIEATVWAYSSYSSDALDLYYASNAPSPVWTFIGTLVPTKAGAQVLSATFTLPSGSLQAIRGQFRWGGSATTCTSGSYNDHDDLVFATQM